jgi:hypothetical protein
VPAFREEPFVGPEAFPFTSQGELNRLVVHPGILEFVEAALGQRDFRLYQAGLWAKYAGAANYSQPLHVDRNHSVVPARPDPGWWFLEGFLYLSDVEEESGGGGMTTTRTQRRRSPRVNPRSVD